MKKMRFAVALTAAAMLAFTGCGKTTTTPTPSANVPVVSESPAIQSPNMSALASPVTSMGQAVVPSPTASANNTSSPAA